MSLTFEEIGLEPKILSAVQNLGFTEPTLIQEKCIPQFLNSTSDIIALAQTGTGKTGAFGLPLIQMIAPESKQVQCIILCPTRELCLQITEDLKSFSKFVQEIRIASVYGGASIENQIKALKKGAQIVVGTPGRVLDLIERGALKLSNIQWLVLDEADEMLDRGFQEDLNAILDETPEEKRTLLFSATFPREISKIAENYMKDPVEIAAGTKNRGAENISHEYYIVPSRKRYEALKRIADIHPEIYGIVFCRTRIETQEVSDLLIKDGYNACALHGGLSQEQRDQAMNRFRIKHFPLLVATDVAARGLDVDDLTHIINYNLPEDLDVYIHRSGRTARAGKNGVCISIVRPDERDKIRQLEKLSGKKFTKLLIPTGKEVCQKLILHEMESIQSMELDDSLDLYLPEIYERLKNLTKEELIQRFVASEFQRLFSYYKNAPDLNETFREKTADGKGRSTGFKKSFSTFRINIGSSKGLTPSGLIKIINERTKNKDISIGHIEISRAYTLFEVEQGYEEELEKAFSKAKNKGVNLVLERTESPFPERRHQDRKRKEKSSFQKSKDGFPRKKGNFSPKKDGFSRNKP